MLISLIVFTILRFKWSAPTTAAAIAWSVSVLLYTFSASAFVFIELIKFSKSLYKPVAAASSVAGAPIKASKLFTACETSSISFAIPSTEPISVKVPAASVIPKYLTLFSTVLITAKI